MFDKEKLAQLLLKARGGRSNEKYSNDSGVSRAYISMMIRGKRDIPPTLDVLFKLACASGIDDIYKDFALAAGFENAEISYTKKTTRNEFATRLKKLRKEHNITQDVLSDYLNLGRTAITNYETNRTSPDIETILSLSDYFGVSTDYLIGSSDIRSDETKYSSGVNSVINMITELNDVDLEKLVKFLKIWQDI